MGLDIVEFVMDVEDTFKVRIPDRVAASLVTPRLLINYIHSRLPQSGESRCLSQRAFYAIRRELAPRVGIPRSQLRPGTELMNVLPSENAQGVWASIGKSLGYSEWSRARSLGWWASIFLRERPRTLGEAARRVVTFTPAVLKPTGEAWSWREVRDVVDGVMHRHIAVRKYSLDDCFAEDLGLC
jgi:hypothetical protein